MSFLQAAVVVSYGMCQKMMNPKKEYNPAVHFVAGVVAGAVGSALTMPLDVCKTLLNTQEAGVLTRIHQTEVNM
jgi:solute carrier family 25 iron transporter 28/37